MKSVLIRILTLILLITIVNIPNTTYAMDNVISRGDSFIAARNNTLPIDEGALEGTSNTIYNILFTIAVVLAVAVGMIIGIQFMLGSVEEQAKVKETLVPYVIGVFIVFASFTIWKIVVEIGDNVSPTPAGTTDTTTQITYTTTMNGTTTKVVCDNCGWEGSTVPSQCPSCNYTFSRGHTTYTKDESTGKLYCDNCNGELSTAEQRRGKCTACNIYIIGI